MNKLRRRTELSVPVAEHIVSQSISTPSLADIRVLARSKTEGAINVLSAIMFRETANPFARVAAANAILDRGWGRPVQPLATDEGPLELLHRIERVIVHPTHSSPTVPQIDEARPLEVPQLVSSPMEDAR